ncbi:MAG: hypothetical protein COA58_04960 [Bacteroidetes bacterium]|nr:MAG: hypothetical protein COA58_04960 [Bacteroidota bacterium]
MISNRLHFLLFFLFGLICFDANAQQIPEKEGTPNYILRNNDFQERRITSSFENFGKNYFIGDSYLSQKNSKNKKSSSWVPKGPYGIDDLAGIGRVNSMRFHPTDTNIWFICVAQGGVWKTINAGESWTSISGDLPILRTSYLAIHPTNPNIMYIALGDFAYLGHNLQANENKRTSHYGLGVYKTINGGKNWMPTDLSFEQTDFEGSLIAKVFIHPTNPDTVIAVGQTGSFLSYDGGVSFSQTNNALFWDLEQHPNSPDILFASTGYVHSYKLGSAGILKSNDFGATWSSATSSIPATNAVQRIELAVSPSDPNYVYAIACDTLGGFFGFYKSTDGGLSFSTKLDNTYQYNILNNSLDDKPGGQGRYDLAISVDKNDKNKVLIGGVNIWQTSNGGTSFVPITYWLLNYYKESLHGDIQEIVQHPTNNSYFVCHDGGFSRSYSIIPDNVADLKNTYVSKTSWTNYTKGLNITSFYRLSVNPQNGNEMMAGAQDNSTVYTSGTDSLFFNLSGGDGMESTFADEVNMRYTSSQNGRIIAYNSFGGGFTYENTIFPPAGESGEWTTPFVFANNQLYIGYVNVHVANYGYLTKSLSNFTGSPFTALDVEKANGQTIYGAKRGYASSGIENNFYASTNGGDTWQDKNTGLPRNLYPSYIEMNQNKPSSVWISFSGFDKDNKIFGSSNGGDTWVNMTYDLPNIPVNTIVQQQDGSDFIYIGTDLGVFYLLPNTTSWIPYNEGMPKVIISELEIDTVNYTLLAATFGRGLWEIDLLEYQKNNVSVSSSSIDFQIKTYPNPVSDVVTLSWSKKISSKNLNLNIIDITGKTVMQKSFSNHINETIINVESFPTGQYYVIMKANNKRYVTSFLKE